MLSSPNNLRVNTSGLPTCRVRGARSMSVDITVRRIRTGARAVDHGFSPSLIAFWRKSRSEGLAHGQSLASRVALARTSLGSRNKAVGFGCKLVQEWFRKQRASLKVLYGVSESRVTFFFFFWGGGGGVSLNSDCHIWGLFRGTCALIGDFPYGAPDSLIHQRTCSQS